MTISIVGAGNVGTHLALALHQAGQKILQVYSRELPNATRLARQINAIPVHQLSAIIPQTDLCLLAVRDDVIGEVAAALADNLPPATVLAHTSGATPSDVIAQHWPNWGVFYPLQTLSKNQPADFARIPMCIDGASESIQQSLHQLAGSISNEVHQVNDSQRATLHLAAVFINNFTNAMLQASHTLTQNARLPEGMLTPLLQATIEKGTRQEPRRAQTGPAIRRDQQTIDRHLGQLTNHPELTAVYKAITTYIQTF
jgi:predicted short-subunit dehydrogenase-like oxidoreductase (DUF2520 family)